jgi:UDP-N-acetylmuramyl pentapeptide synthase
MEDFMKINRILKGINYKELIGSEEVEVKDFSKDTRTINEGDIYVGIKGENFDGNTFYNKAFEAGASACLLDNVDVTEELRKYVDVYEKKYGPMELDDSDYNNYLWYEGPWPFIGGGFNV